MWQGVQGKMIFSSKRGVDIVLYNVYMNGYILRDLVW